MASTNWIALQHLHNKAHAVRDHCRAKLNCVWTGLTVKVSRTLIQSTYVMADKISKRLE